MTYITDIKQASTILTANNVKLITFNQNIAYDSGLSQINFNDFISNASGTCEVQKFASYLILYAEDVSKDDEHFNEEGLSALSDDELTKLYDGLGLYYHDLNSKDDLIEELLNLSHEDYYNKHYNENHYHRLEYDFTFSGEYRCYKVKTVGTIPDYINSEYLTNLFFESPIDGNIEVSINGEVAEEIPVYDFLGNVYDIYDKDVFIKSLSSYLDKKDYDYKDLLLQWCEEELPKSINYVG